MERGHYFIDRYSELTLNVGKLRQRYVMPAIADLGLQHAYRQQELAGESVADVLHLLCRHIAGNVKQKMSQFMQCGEPLALGDKAAVYDNEGYRAVGISAESVEILVLGNLYYLDAVFFKNLNDI